MKTVFLIFFVTVICLHNIQLCHGYRSKGAAIAEHAREQIGSTKYPYTDSFWDFVMGQQYRGHLFVADILKDLGVLYPKRRLPSYPVYAEEWANPRSPRLQVLSMCWRSCLGQPVDGDIIAYDRIVGIVTSHNRITFSDPNASPPGLIQEVRSLYVPKEHGVCWRYRC